MSKSNPISPHAARMAARALNYQIQSMQALSNDWNGESRDLRESIAETSMKMCDAIKASVQGSVDDANRMDEITPRRRRYHSDDE